MGATLDAAAQTMQIKTALIDADNLDANNIDVDTNADTKTVTLKGHVATASQKAAAERIAKEKAPDYRVVNSLVIEVGRVGRGVVGIAMSPRTRLSTSRPETPAALPRSELPPHNPRMRARPCFICVLDPR